jgi:BMFP domain-containing protein YqiC
MDTMALSPPDFAAHLAELQQRLQALSQTMTQADRNQLLQTLISGVADRFELVRQDEFDAQRRQLQRALEQIAQLEARLAQLESGQTLG